jgi:hypothetical protein
MMKKKGDPVKLSAIFLSILSSLIGIQTWACVSAPKDFTLKDSTFSQVANLGLSSNCGFALWLTSKKQDAATELVYKKRDQIIENWEKRNPEASSKDRLDFKKDVTLDNPTPLPLFEHSLTTKNKSFCFKTDDDKECTTAGTFNLTEEKKIFGIIEFTEEQAFIFSVDEKGKKDIRKPYLKISLIPENSAEIISFHHSKPVGRMHVNGETCAKSAPTANGSLELYGKEYIPNSAGCKGSYAVKDFKPTVAKDSVGRQKR